MSDPSVYLEWFHSARIFTGAHLCRITGQDHRPISFVSELSASAEESNAPVLLHPGQFVRIKRTGARVVIIGHEIDVGTVVYRVASPNGVGETGFLVKDLDRCE